MKRKLGIALLLLAMLIQAALCSAEPTLVVATEDLTGETFPNGEGALKMLEAAAAGGTEVWKQVWDQLYKQGKVVFFPKGTKLIKTGDDGWFGKFAHVKPVNSVNQFPVRVYRAYLQPVE